MKFCLTSNTGELIKVQYKDIQGIYNLIEKYPNKEYVLEIKYTDIEIDWAAIKELNILSKGRLILCLPSVETMKLASDADIRFYYGFPVENFSAIAALQELGVSYLRLGSPLFFQQDRVRAFNIPVIFTPNVCYEDDFFHQNGVYGQWIRPEDIDKYCQEDDIIQFTGVSSEQEEILHQIYLEKSWLGKMHMLFKDFHAFANNKLIGDEIAERRLNCGQRCKEGSCHICKTAVSLAEKYI